ncbi:glucooligosaccharide oxidase [Agrocybe pediades]|nr:glucooligosaccharide oxidase [Agrocybe pediades]
MKLNTPWPHRTCAVSLVLASLALLGQATFISGLGNITNIASTVPGDAGYTNVSAAFNLRYDLQPNAVVFPKTPDEVSEILLLCTQHNFRAVARSGGHSYIANGVGGQEGYDHKAGVVVIDLGAFISVTVDEESGVASIGTGNKLGDVALALNNAGRALPHGTCPYVGIGGHSGHGGYGFTSRAWGLTLDTTTALEVVLADGTILTASEENQPDLFWALRGSSSSFGVVTTIYAKTFPAPPSATVFRYNWDMTASAASAAAKAFQSFILSESPPLPAELGGAAILRPSSTNGSVSFGFSGGWYAPLEGLDAVLQPFLSVMPTPRTSSRTTGTYIASVQNWGGIGRLNTTGIPDTHDTFYAKSLTVPQHAPMSNASWDALMNYLGNEGFNASTSWFIDMDIWGGSQSAINNVSFESTSFAHRDSLFTFQFYTSAHGGVPPFPQDGFTLLDGMVDTIVSNNPQGWEYGAYLNYIDDRENDWRRLYYGSHYARLRDVKRRYDPFDTFHFPRSVEE